jgi:hypothetical protein
MEARAKVPKLQERLRESGVFIDAERVKQAG